MTPYLLFQEDGHCPILESFQFFFFMIIKEFFYVRWKIFDV